MTTQSQKPKVLIRTIDNEILQIYNKLATSGKQLKKSCFFVSNTRKVHPKALIEAMEKFSKLCVSKKLKNTVRDIMIDVKKMCSGGDTRMFICHDNEEDGSKLEFICAVVYVYKCEGGQACGKCNACKSCKEPQRCESCNYCKACQEPFDCQQCNPCKAGKKCTEPKPCGGCKLCKKCNKPPRCASCNYCKACQKPFDCRQCESCKAGKKCKKAIPCGECKSCRKCKVSVSCGRCEECRRCEGPVACNYLLSTYSYQEKVNKVGVGVGIGMTVGGVLAGGVALAACFATGGIGFLVAGGIAAAAGAGTSVSGGIIIRKSTDTNISAQLTSLLEASFIYELSARALAKIENGSLYLCLEN